MSELLLCFTNQTYKNFKITIVNNNIQETKNIDSLIEKYKQYFEISAIHNNNNLGGRARFIVARTSDCKFCVFLDDDQLIKNTVLHEMSLCAKENHIYSWWAWMFNNSYWNRKRVGDNEVSNYCGTGGMICDSSIFKNSIFWDNWKEEFYFVEDLYLSLFAKSIGWDLRGKCFSVYFNKNSSDENSIYLQNGISALKDKLSKTF